MKEKPSNQATSEEIKEGKVITFDEHGRVFYVAKEDNLVTRTVAKISALGHGMPRQSQAFAGIRKKTNGGGGKDDSEIFLVNTLDD